MTTTTKKDALIADLVASIKNEQNSFDMSQWVTDCLYFDAPLLPTVSCETASCMAGHLVAVRPEAAARVAVALGPFWTFDKVAKQLWCEETGDEFCPLDFFGMRHTADGRREVNLDAITRDEAISHIRGTHPTWPQVDGEP